MKPPAPLRTDGSNAFARYSMQVRVPGIAREVIQRNPDYPAAIRHGIERLARDIENDASIGPALAPAPDVEAWNSAEVAHPQATWLDADWFFAELSFYRELAQACRYWENGRDPFEPAKNEELASPQLWERLETVLAQGGSREERLVARLDAALWGNRVDLSYAVAAARGREKDDLLVDDRVATTSLITRVPAFVHVVADNTGTELAMDLALVAAILEDPTARVVIHVKMQPVFVSDATASDVLRLVARMRDRGGSASHLGASLAGSFDTGRLRLAPDPYWSGPSFLWDAPKHLRRTLGSASLVVIKGDANYRRVVGDALWAPSTPLVDACGYVPNPIVFLRTMKSDPVLGLPSGMAAALDAVDSRWRIDGRRGVISFKP